MIDARTATDDQLRSLGSWTQAYGDLAEFALAKLPAIDVGEAKCCAEHCGACMALLALLDNRTAADFDDNILTSVLAFDRDEPTADWWVNGRVDPQYLEDRISRECNCGG